MAHCSICSPHWAGWLPRPPWSETARQDAINPDVLTGLLTSSRFGQGLTALHLLAAGFGQAGWR
ncbi:MAG: hypothetical protein H7173_13980 [Rhodoferax sp.]|nr:hypothetical protein [Pseudorhodobacter sp.]